MQINVVKVFSQDSDNQCRRPGIQAGIQNTVVLSCAIEKAVATLQTLLDAPNLVLLISAKNFQKYELQTFVKV